MMKTFRTAAASAALGFAMLTAGAPAAKAQATQAPAKHHSLVKGALVGAAAGHMLGHHAKVGAAAGALWQHHKNKKAAR